MEQARLAGVGQQRLASTPVGLRLERVACLVVLADPAHSRAAVAETGGDLGCALALVVELNDPLADSNRDGFHTRSLSPFAALSLHDLWNCSSTANLGAVASVRGSVVDVRFDGQLPPIYSVLRSGTKNEIIIEVLAQLDARHVRGIALTPTQGLGRGMVVTDTGGPLKAPVGKSILSRMFDVFGNAIDRQAGIDEELFDVISGFEALSKGNNPQSVG